MVLCQLPAELTALFHACFLLQLVRRVGIIVGMLPHATWHQMIQTCHNVCPAAVICCSFLICFQVGSSKGEQQCSLTHRLR